MTLSRKRVLFASPWWHAEIVNGTLRHASEHGWHVDLQTCLSGKLPKRWDGDGIITVFGTDIGAFKRLLAQARCPAVSLNNNYPEIDIPRVCQDDTVAGQLAAGHFLERGFTSFAFYSHGASPQSTAMRLASFSEAIAQAGHTVEPILWKPTRRSSDNWLDRQQWLASKLVSLPKPLAVFALNDLAAVEVIEACMSQSLAIPRDVAVLGMLDMAIFRHCTTVALSSIRVDFDAITRTACDLLSDMMAGKPQPDHPILFPPSEIAVRQSTDTYAARSPVVAKAVRFMHENYASPIGVEQIVQASSRSRAGLFMAFQSDLGMTPGQMLSRIRVDQAKRMLRDTRVKVYAVAHDCGFGDVVNLHRAFKQATGLSPNAYRKAQREKSPRERQD
ncbi:MAG: helix-turn-helix domain-containing protein [Phycisphaera sp.]|nr:helix-turn-helix domain-containing protein [Phycisphaera sp.]